MLISDIPRRNARLYSTCVAVIDGDRQLTWAEVDRRATRLANALITFGIEKGDHVAVLDHNTFRYVELYFACARAGAAVVPLNYRGTVDELQYMIDNADTRVLFFGADYLHVVEQLRERLPRLGAAVCEDAKVEGFDTYERLLEEGSDVSPDVEVDEDDVAVLGYTGGTTGLPKGVMTTHRNVVASCFGLTIDCRLSHEDRYLAVPPLFHAGGAMGMFAESFAGATIVILRKFSPENVLHAIEAHHITHVLLVPVMILAIVHSPVADAFDLSSLRGILYGTAPIRLDLLREAIRFFPCPLLQVYGATETFVPMANLLYEDHVLDGTPAVVRRLASCGREAYGVHLRVIDDDGRDVPLGEVGEIVARGDNVMVGYWRLPELTAATLRGRWYHTGDLGRMDEDGYLYVVDRGKVMFVSVGENGHPNEIEQVLDHHPGVAEVAIGVPDEYWGETATALVVTRPGSELTVDELMDDCRIHLAGYKRPRSIVLVESLPHSSTGKVLKEELRRAYWEHLDRKV